MKRLFLSSYFKDVAHFFSDFANETIKGKTVTFIPTASISETVKFYVKSGRKALEKMGLNVDELEITKADRNVIATKLQNNDYIYVTGGNTFFLLQELKRKGADQFIKEQVNSGKIYIGESAGTMILSPNVEYAKDMDSINKAPDLKNLTALAVIDFYPIPHHTNFPFKKATEKIILKYGSELKLIPFSNSQAIVVDGFKTRIINL